MKKKWLIGALGTGALVGLMAFAQDDPIPQLRVALANLGLRVDRLESAGGPANGAGRGASDAASARSMVLVSVHLSDHSGDNADEIADLKRQCSAIMDTVNNKADQTAADLGAAVDGGTVWVRGGVNGWAWGDAGAAGAAIADKETENRYATLHAIKQEKLEALQRAADQPLQIILGHHDNVIIVLQTKIDLSTSLNDVAIGDVVTWAGTRTSVDDTSETWRIESIKKVGSK